MQTEQVLEAFERRDFVALALCEIGTDGQCGLVVGMPKQGGAEVEQGFVAVAVGVKLQGDQAVGARIVAVGFQHAAQRGQCTLVLVQAPAGFALKEEQGVDLVGRALTTVDEEGVDPLGQFAVLACFAQTLGQRNLRFAVVGTVGKEVAKSLFGIVPLSACHENFGDVETQHVVARRVGIVDQGRFEGALCLREGVSAQGGEGFAHLAAVGGGVARCDGFDRARPRPYAPRESWHQRGEDTTGGDESRKQKAGKNHRALR